MLQIQKFLWENFRIAECKGFIWLVTPEQDLILGLKSENYINITCRMINFARQWEDKSDKDLVSL